MSGKDKDDKNWAGKGFGQRNDESAPEPVKDDPDNEEWAWK